MRDPRDGSTVTVTLTATAAAMPPTDARAAASRLTKARVIFVPHGGHSAGGLTGMHRPPFATSLEEARR